jgi:glutaredoxin-related protein
MKQNKFVHELFTLKNVGKATYENLNGLGIHSIKDLQLFMKPKPESSHCGGSRLKFVSNAKKMVLFIKGREKKITADYSLFVQILVSIPSCSSIR